ncbi:hypothetical protein [Agrobacterium tumefaciens]|uniref:hypothetical protein n=1 Tax=Agrobacterium tumefaciens TaxID=358 RepID=UPI00287DAF28|nr:hypothetical protein [Agrobacterium tumefaciens]MDS7597782.1 hypothetical protein [Agrobacterium tumefaciens]
MFAYIALAGSCLNVHRQLPMPVDILGVTKSANAFHNIKIMHKNGDLGGWQIKLPHSWNANAVMVYASGPRRKRFSRPSP